MNSDLLRQSSCRYNSLTFASVSGWSHNANLYLSFGTEILQHSLLAAQPRNICGIPPFIRFATPFFSEYEFSNPFLFSGPESRKSPTRPALPGAVNHAGVQQQPLHFLPLAFRPCPKPVKSPRNQCLSKPGRHCPNTAPTDAGPSVFPTHPRKPRHRATGWATRAYPAVRSYPIFLSGSSMPSNRSKQHSV